MLFQNTVKIISLHVTVGNIKPSASWGPQLSPKGVKTMDVCTILNEKLTCYKDGDVIAIRVHMGPTVSGKTPWNVEVKGRILIDYLKEILGIKIYNKPTVISEEKFETIYTKIMEDPFRFKSLNLRKSIIASLGGYQITIE